MLLCGFSVGHLSFIWWVRDLFSSQTVNHIWLTHPWSAPLEFPFTHTPSRLCCSSVTTSGGRSEGERNCHPSPPLELSHEVGYRRMIPTLKGQMTEFYLWVTCSFNWFQFGGNYKDSEYHGWGRREELCTSMFVVCTLSADTITQILVLFSEKTKLVSRNTSLKYSISISCSKAKYGLH